MAVHEEAKPAEKANAKAAMQAKILGGAFVVMMASRIVGAAISPMLLAHAPIALLVLSPVIGHLVIVAALTEPFAYYAPTITISIAHCLLGFFLGRMQGPMLVGFLVRRRIASENRLERLLAPLRVSAPLLVFVVPGPIVCALAGASAVPRRTFLPALVGSQILWAVMCRLSGQALLGGIASMREWIVRHAIPLTVATVLLVVFIHFRRSRGTTDPPK